MPSAVVAGGANHAPVGTPQSGGVVPFHFGSFSYTEKIPGTFQQLLDGAIHEFAPNITPGGFLRGVRMQVRSTGGVLGGATITGDAPWNVFRSVSIENIDGAPLVYPQPGYVAMARQWFGRPWHGDPSRRFDYSATINPAFSLFLQPEIRWGVGVLSNTDARAQYRIRFTLAPLTDLATGGAPTAPTVTVTLFMESYAQPDASDLVGRPIEEKPPGLAIQTISRRQILQFNAAGSDNTFQMANMGNEIRLILLIARNSAGVRTDLLSDPVRWRLDTRSLGVFSPDEIWNRMSDFYESLQTGSTRPTGVYALHRFFDKGRMVGDPWMTTTNATYNVFDSATGAGGTGGTLEIITDELTPISNVPGEFESI